MTAFSLHLLDLSLPFRCLSAQFAAYEQYKAAVAARGRPELNHWEPLLAGGVSKVFASTLTYPYQVPCSALFSSGALQLASPPLVYLRAPPCSVPAPLPMRLFMHAVVLPLLILLLCLLPPQVVKARLQQRPNVVAPAAGGAAAVVEAREAAVHQHVLALAGLLLVPIPIRRFQSRDSRRS